MRSAGPTRAQASISSAGTAAIACGAILVYLRGAEVAVLMGVGAVFVLFYTWPLKGIGLGEFSVWLVWGPLMIAGTAWIAIGSYVTGSLPASALLSAGPTSVRRCRAAHGLDGSPV